MMKREIPTGSGNAAMLVDRHAVCKNFWAERSVLYKLRQYWEYLRRKEDVRTNNDE